MASEVKAQKKERDTSKTNHKIIFRVLVRVCNSNCRVSSGTAIMPNSRAYIALAGLILAFLDSHGKDVAPGGSHLFTMHVSAFQPSPSNTYCLNRRTSKSNALRWRPTSHRGSQSCNPIGIGNFYFGSPPAITSNHAHASGDETTTSNNNTDTDSGQSNSTSSSSYKKNGLQVTPELVADLKSSIPLTQVIESFNLPQFRQTSPTRAVALCPFHNDNNPSMHIDDERGLYKCFSCGAGGDVFNFIREYKLVEEGGEKMGFIDAVKFVAEEYADGTLSSGGVGESSFGSSRFRSQRGEGGAELTKDQKAKRERLALANAAAAEFYGKCLASLPAAGAARSHLRARGVQPETVRRFALGFAPDAYFGQQGRHGARAKWGEGSLVDRLKGVGFTAEEIVDAGLATRVNRKHEKKELNNDDTKPSGGRALADASESQTIETNNEEESYADLMDRFRGRLVVPIFDDDGRRVVGFGGRHIDGPASSTLADSGDKNFTPAKYLNSPESQIFSKKEVLFGVPAAKKAIDKRRVDYAKATLGSAPLAPTQSSTARAPCLVVVEGYFDVISLASAGIEEAVASMGTALTQEQLGIAAKVVGPGSSKIILCFDADEAGQAAMERLCESNILSKTVEKHGVNIHIAKIPDKSIKDPADFVQARGGDAFRSEVLDASISWTDWYIERMALNHQLGDSDAKADSDLSVVEICDKISTFLASFDPAERTRLAYTAASTLAQILSDTKAMNGTSPQVSTSSLQIRLESDLLSQASRKAGARDAIADRIERIESADTSTLSSQPTFASPGALVAKMSSGEGVTSLVDEVDYGFSLPPADDGDDRRKGRSYEYKEDKFGGGGTEEPNASASNNGRRHTVQSGGYSSRRPFPSKNAKAPPLTPHFSGFEFANPTDAAWLGFYNSNSGTRRRDPPLVAGGGGLVERRLMREAIEAGETYVSLDNENQLVYFNSNTFHGNKFLTKEAREAGYGESGITYDASEIGLGVPALVEQDADKLLLDAEDRLLRALVHYPSARAAIKGAVITSLNSGTGAGPALIEWSNQDREWLFECLADSPGRIPIPSELQEGGTAQQLRDYLAELPDAPEGAFDSMISAHNEPPLTNAMQDGESPMREAGIEGEALDSSPLHDRASSTTSPNANGPVGRLETYFSNNDEVESLAQYQKSELSRETRAELLVQETLAAMLRATALKRMALLKQRWTAAATALELRLNENVNTLEENDGDNSTVLTIESGASGDVEPFQMHSDTKSKELSSLCSTLGEQLAEAMQTVKELDESSKRIGARLMDYCSTDGSSYRMSTAKRERFIKMLDDHLENLPEDPKPTTSGGDGDYIFGIDEFDDSIDSQFGGAGSEPLDEFVEDDNIDDGRYSGIVEDYELDDDEGVY